MYFLALFFLVCVSSLLAEFFASSPSFFAYVGFKSFFPLFCVFMFLQGARMCDCGSFAGFSSRISVTQAAKSLPRLVVVGLPFLP